MRPSRRPTKTGDIEFCMLEFSSGLQTDFLPCITAFESNVEVYAPDDPVRPQGNVSSLRLA